MRALIRHALFLALTGFLCVEATAQGLLTKPLWLVVPFPAGTSTDSSGRIIADGLAKELGRPVLVENKAGAGGNIGSDHVARKRGDRDILLLGTTGNLAVNKWLMKALPYDPVSDFTPLTLAFTSCNVLVVSGTSVLRSMADLIAAAKAEPGRLNYGSPGIGTAGHLAAEWFKQKMGIDITHVPYRGGPRVIQDLISGQIQLSFEAVGNALPLVRDGRLRAIASTCESRIPTLPEVPTMIEAGVEGFVIRAWGMLAAPADVPREWAEQLSRALVKVIGSDAVRARLNASGVVAETSSLAETRRFLESEGRKWKMLVEGAGIEPQ
jgi:tripartite-type tricarboxylate transporter receptor subunit TctC